jgi:NSS family neurotransmitter:Na+ symporter
VSVIEVVISAVRDKFEMSRTGAALAVTVPATIISLLFFSTTSGIYVLDIVDHFINQFGILLVAVVSMLVLAWGLRTLPLLADHLNDGGSIRLGLWWRVLISVVAPIALLYVLARGLWTDIETPYEGYPTWMLAVFGWGAAVAVIVFGFLAARMRWRDQTPLTDPESDRKEVAS